MNPLVKSRWVERLRSGRIRKISGALRRQEGTACALGVLCYLAVEDGVLDKPESYGFVSIGSRHMHWDEEIGEYHTCHLTECEKDIVHNGTLPREVVEWAGLNDDDPLLYAVVTEEDDYGREQEVEAERNITALNDDNDLSFDQIAKLIDDQL